MKFAITITQEKNSYVASCHEMPEVTARADSMNVVLKEIKAAIKKKLDDDSGGGASPKPHPHSPTPRGPIIAAESHEIPE